MPVFQSEVPVNIDFLARTSISADATNGPRTGQIEHLKARTVPQRRTVAVRFVLCRGTRRTPAQRRIEPRIPEVFDRRIRSFRYKLWVANHRERVWSPSRSRGSLE